MDSKAIIWNRRHRNLYATVTKWEIVDEIQQFEQLCIYINKYFPATIFLKLTALLDINLLLPF